MAWKRVRTSVITSRLKAFAYFLDTFNPIRSAWKVLTGSWTGSGGTASTSTAPSSYPLAVVKMSKSNVTASLKSTTNGSGIAIWATDSGNWWGVVTGQNSGQQCNCLTGYNCNGYICNSSYYVCNSNYAYVCNCTGGGNIASWNASYYYACGGGNCSAWASYSPYICGLYGTSCGQCTTWNAISYCFHSADPASWNATYYFCCSGGNCASSYYQCNSTNCTGYSPYTYGCQTCYPATIRIIKSVANTVTEVTSWVVSTVVNSLKVITSGTGITAKPYSDNNLTTQIGADLTYSANNATIDTKFGIVVAPSTYSQGTTTGAFEATSN